MASRLQGKESTFDAASSSWARDRVWDNLNTQRNRVVKAFTSKHKRLHLEFLPPYAPKLNPAEWSWKDGKCHALANQGLKAGILLFSSLWSCPTHAPVTSMGRSITDWSWRMGLTTRG